MFIIFKIPPSPAIPFSSGVTSGQSVSSFSKLHNGIVTIQLSTPIPMLELETDLQYTTISYDPDTQKWWLECISTPNNKAIEIELIHVDHHDILIAD